jgi:hypothetical protein
MKNGGRKDAVKSDLPGPGNYEPSNHLIKDKVISFKIGSPRDGNERSRSADK